MSVFGHPHKKLQYFLCPRVYCYFDDVFDANYGICEFNGELLAIKEFNEENILKKMFGKKEVETDKANKVEEIRVKFTIDKNTLWYEISNHKLHSKPVGNQIKLNQKNSSFNLFPNPAKDFSLLKFNSSNEQNAQFVLYNSNGQLITYEPIQFTRNLTIEKRVNTSELENGLYFCGLLFENGKRFLEKLVVLR